MSMITKSNKSKEELLNDLDIVVDEFIQKVEEIDVEKNVFENWSGADLLRHIVFWHLTYVGILHSLEKGEKPFLMKGSSTRNVEGVELLKKFSVKQLIRNLRKTNKEFIQILANNNFKVIPYTLKTRTYTTKEYIYIITRHIQRHTADLKKCK